MFKPGDPVFCNVGGEVFIGLVFAGAHQNHEGETKYTIQVGAEKHDLAHREPKDRDDHGSGGTFWAV